ncbi:MAG: hypothetical protein WBL93_11125 [Lutisporaceae bacterium]
MKCKNCAHFIKSNSVEFSEDITDKIGSCNLSGAITKSKEQCKNGNFERK